MNPHRVTIRAGTPQIVVGLLCCALLGGCSSSSDESAAQRGQRLFESKALSSSSLNDYTCANCHDAVASDPPTKKAGAPLAGATLRPLFWAGQEADLLRAINACRNYFMIENSPLAATDADARSLYAYLESLEPGDDGQQPFTIVTEIEALPRGDEANGRLLYGQACQSCHGTVHTGEGRLSERVPVIPDDTLLEPEHVNLSARVQRLVFTEKIRHGLFLGYSGVMPPFSAELLSDTEVSDVLEALGVLGE